MPTSSTAKTEPKVGDIWYRFHDWRTAPPIDEYGHPIGSGRVNISLSKFVVARVTPKGVRLIEFYTKEPPTEDYFRYYGDWPGRWVSLSSRKRFACPSIAEARESFKRRKAAQLRIYEARARAAKQALALAKEEGFVGAYAAEEGDKDAGLFDS